MNEVIGFLFDFIIDRKTLFFQLSDQLFEIAYICYSEAVLRLVDIPRIIFKIRIFGFNDFLFQIYIGNFFVDNIYTFHFTGFDFFFKRIDIQTFGGFIHFN